MTIWCKISAFIVLAVVWVTFLAFIYACCVVSSREDRWLEEQERRNR